MNGEIYSNIQSYCIRARDEPYECHWIVTSPCMQHVLTFVGQLYWSSNSNDKHWIMITIVPNNHRLQSSENKKHSAWLSYKASTPAQCTQWSWAFQQQHPLTASAVGFRLPLKVMEAKAAQTDERALRAELLILRCICHFQWKVGNGLIKVTASQLK